MENIEFEEGMTVYLKQPCRGYRAVTLIEKYQNRWLVEIAESGLQIEVYEDELEIY